MGKPRWSRDMEREVSKLYEQDPDNLAGIAEKFGTSIRAIQTRLRQMRKASSRSTHKGGTRWSAKENDELLDLYENKKKTLEYIADHLDRTVLACETHLDELLRNGLPVLDKEASSHRPTTRSNADKCQADNKRKRSPMPESDKAASTESSSKRNKTGVQKISRSGTASEEKTREYGYSSESCTSDSIQAMFTKKTKQSKGKKTVRIKAAVAAEPESIVVIDSDDAQERTMPGKSKRIPPKSTQQQQSKVSAAEPKSDRILSVKPGVDPISPYGYTGPASLRKLWRRTPCPNFINCKSNTCPYSHLVCLDWARTGECARGDHCIHCHGSAGQKIAPSTDQPRPATSNEPTRNHGTQPSHQSLEAPPISETSSGQVSKACTRKTNSQVQTEKKTVTTTSCSNSNVQHHASSRKSIHGQSRTEKLPSHKNDTRPQQSGQQSRQPPDASVSEYSIPTGPSATSRSFRSAHQSSRSSRENHDGGQRPQISSRSGGLQSDISSHDEAHSHRKTRFDVVVNPRTQATRPANHSEHVDTRNDFYPQTTPRRSQLPPTPSSCNSQLDRYPARSVATIARRHTKFTSNELFTSETVAPSFVPRSIWSDRTRYVP